MSSEQPDFWSVLETDLPDPDDHVAPVPVGDDGEWLRRAPYSVPVDAASTRQAGRLGLHRVLVQGRRCRDVPDALRSLGDALELPGYYGQNYDALDECLRELLIIENGYLGSRLGDRVGRPCTGMLMVVDFAEDFLGNESPENRDNLMRVLRRGAKPLPDPLGRAHVRVGSFFVLLVDRPDK